MTAVASQGAPRRSRAEWHRLMSGLREQGLNGLEIARELGVSSSFVYEVLNDPDGSKVRARKKRYGGVCVDCGAPTFGGDGRAKAAKRCASCRAAYQREDEYREAMQTWARARILAAIQWWAAEYGEPPAICDWNPSDTRHRLHDEPRAARAERLIARGRIPWFTHVVKRFGSWNAGIAAAGFEPRAPHGTAESARRWRKARRTRVAA